MGTRRILMIVFLVLGIAFVALGIYYFATPAGSLPSFFPGYIAASSHIHVKHGAAALILGILCFLGAWMTSGKEQKQS